MTSRETRKTRREAERKAKKLEWKQNHLAANQPVLLDPEFPEIQPRWSPELEDEFPREVQIRNNAMLDRIDRKAGRPIPPPGPDPADDLESIRRHFLVRRAAAASTKPLSEPANADPALAEMTAAAPATPEPEIAEPPAGFVSQTESAPPTRAEINRRNSQLSTGPRSSQGKLASSRNSFKHGLTAGHTIIPGEDPAEFESLLNALLDEHQPATPTEELLTKQLAQSHWLTQRAIRLQNDCFTPDGVNEKQLALFLRYQTTHQRAFYKALSDLLKLKKARQRFSHTALKAAPGFVSQQPLYPESANGFVSHTPPETYVHSPTSGQNSPL